MRAPRPGRASATWLRSSLVSESGVETVLIVDLPTKIVVVVRQRAGLGDNGRNSRNNTERHASDRDIPSFLACHSFDFHPSDALHRHAPASAVRVIIDLNGLDAENLADAWRKVSQVTARLARKDLGESLP